MGSEIVQPGLIFFDACRLLEELRVAVWALEQKGGAAGSTTGRLDKVVANAFCTTRCIEGGKGSWIYVGFTWIYMWPAKY